MILRDVSIVMVVVIVLFSASIGWVSAKFLGEDNHIEEHCEDHIETHTGIRLDLTPSSKEVKK